MLGLASMLGWGGLSSCAIGGLMALMGLAKGHEARQLGAARQVETLSGGLPQSLCFFVYCRRLLALRSTLTKNNQQLNETTHCRFMLRRAEAAAGAGACADSGDGASDGLQANQL
jgi:hypothetical protein